MSGSPEVREASLRGLAWMGGSMLLGLLVVMGACSLVGQYGFAWPWDLPAVWRLRMMRITAAAVVGAGLAVGGCSLQSLLRNGLASPYVLGISTGSGVGVLLGMTWFSHALWAGAPLMATAGALAAMATVYLIAQRRGLLDVYSLLLAGVIVNAFNSAVMLFIYLYANPYVISEYIAWATGQFPDSPDPALLASCSALTLLGWAYLVSRGHAFNVQSLGDDVALSSGVNVHVLRVATFAVASLMTAAAVSMAGPVGFVGLIVPHICRMLLGSDHRRLLLASGFVGAALIVAVDTFCRSTPLWFGLELPVGVLTALGGAPFFVWLLRRQRMGGEA